MVASLGAGNAQTGPWESNLVRTAGLSCHSRADVCMCGGCRINTSGTPHFSCAISAPSLIEMYKVKNIAAHGAVRHNDAVMKVSSTQAMFIDLYLWMHAGSDTCRTSSQSLEQQPITRSDGTYRVATILAIVPCNQLEFKGRYFYRITYLFFISELCGSKGKWKDLLNFGLWSGAADHPVCCLAGRGGGQEMMTGGGEGECGIGCGVLDWCTQVWPPDMKNKDGRSREKEWIELGVRLFSRRFILHFQEIYRLYWQKVGSPLLKAANIEVNAFTVLQPRSPAQSVWPRTHIEC